MLESGARERFDGLLGEDLDAAVERTWLSPERLGHVRRPVLLVHGREDRPVPFDANVPHLLGALPHAHLLALARCGHNRLREHPGLALGAAMAVLGAD